MPGTGPAVRTGAARGGGRGAAPPPPVGAGSGGGGPCAGLRPAQPGPRGGGTVRVWIRMCGAGLRSVRARG